MKFKTIKAFLEWLIIDDEMDWADGMPYVGASFDRWSIKVFTGNRRTFGDLENVDCITGTFTNTSHEQFLELASDNCWHISIVIEEDIQFDTFYILKNPNANPVAEEKEMNIIEL